VKHGKRVTFTDREREIYDLRHSTKPEMPFEAMGKALGITKGSAHSMYHKIVRKMERAQMSPEEVVEKRRLKKARNGKRARLKFDDPDKSPPEAQNTGTPSFEKRDPQTAAAVLDEVSHALRPSMAAIGRKYGVPIDLLNRFMERVDRQYRALVEEVKAPRLQELVDLTGARARAVLQSITPEDIESASLRDKAVAISILVEKHLLLEGRPTQIIENREDDQNLDRVIGFVLEEANRRGITFDLDPTTGAINPIRDDPSQSYGPGAGKFHQLNAKLNKENPGG